MRLNAYFRCFELSSMVSCFRSFIVLTAKLREVIHSIETHWTSITTQSVGSIQQATISTTFMILSTRCLFKFPHPLPLSLNFLLRQVYDVIPSPVNLCQWNLTDNPNVRLCEKKGSLFNTCSGKLYMYTYRIYIKGVALRM